MSPVPRALPLKEGPLPSQKSLKNFRGLDILLFVVGVMLLLGLIRFLGVESIGLLFRKVGWTLIPLVLVYGVWQMCYAYAWTLTFPTQPPNLSFWKVFGVYLAGDAINYCIPSGNLAGEPVKPYLLKEHLPIREGMASVIINKLSETISMVIFLTLGVVTAFARFPLPTAFKAGVLVVYGGTVAAVVLFFWRQKKGLLGSLFSFFSRFPFLSPFLQQKTGSANEIDQCIHKYYQDHSSRLAASLFFNVLGWMGGALELVWVLWILGLPGALAAAWVIEAFSLLVNNLFFFLPARVGGGESGKALIFSTFGFGAATGLSFGIIRRVRELFWVGVGFSFLFAWRVFPRLRRAT